MLWSLKIRIEKLNPSKAGIKRGGGEKRSAGKRGGRAEILQQHSVTGTAGAGTGNGEMGQREVMGR